MRKSSIFLIAALAFAAAPAMAYADDDLNGLEMDVQDANGTPHDAAELTLPDEASDEASEHAQHGVDTANSAREDGEEVGEDAAEAAHDSHGDAGGDGQSEDTPGAH